MTDEAPQELPERILTDESLRSERLRSDLALAKSQAVVEEDADAIILQERENADEVLDEARATADERLAQAETLSEEQAVLDRERAAADAVVRQARDVADESLRRAREEQSRILARLLPLEREKTDRYLLTERLRADDAVEHRDDFLRIVTHDLRNLLSGIVLSNDAMSEELDESSPPGLSVNVARVNRYAARMSRLIEDLVDVGSIDGGNLAIQPVAGELGALVTEVVDSFQGSAGAKSISLKVVHLDPLLRASFDHGRIMQVFANLLSNAIKFTPRGGKIEVRGAVMRGGQRPALRFTVSDDGPGIPPTMLQSVFERFWQVGKDDRRGLGLGLFISRCIVEAHGGTIWAESRLGEGSRFLFELPASAG